jgi:hypothetical protein
MEEMDLPWGQVAESDEVFSPKAGRWFEVESTRATRDGIVVKAKGVAKPWPAQDPRKMVKVRRGATGEAVDMFIIAFSGEMEEK